MVGASSDDERTGRMEWGDRSGPREGMIAMKENG